MAEAITLEISEDVVDRAREIAQRTQRRLEDVLVDWIDRYASELPIDDLPDDEVMALANMQMAEGDQTHLSELLSLNREGQLNDGQRVELEALMQIYRQGLRRKAQAMKVAVERGLMQPLS